MENFWDFNVWSGFNLIAVLLIVLLLANSLKKIIRPLQASLIIFGISKCDIVQCGEIIIMIRSVSERDTKTPHFTLQTPYLS